MPARPLGRSERRGDLRKDTPEIPDRGRALTKRARTEGKPQHDGRLEVRRGVRRAEARIDPAPVFRAWRHAERPPAPEGGQSGMLMMSAYVHAIAGSSPSGDCDDTPIEACWFCGGSSGRSMPTKK